MLDEARRLDGTDGDYVEFASAGAEGTGVYHCSGCGYGVTVQATLPRCPMCGGTTWEPATWGSLMRPSGPLQ